MALHYGTQMTKLRGGSVDTLPMAGDVHGRVRCFNESVSLASQAVGDSIEVGRLPKGARLLFGILNSSVSLGAATIAIGVLGDLSRYRSGATLTTANLPILFGSTAAVGEALEDETTPILTIGGAALPAAGTLRIQWFYTLD